MTTSLRRAGPAALLLTIALLAAARGGEPAESPKPGSKAKPKPVADYLTTPAGDVKNATQAWARGRELEKDTARPERERLCAALPYYLYVVRKGARGAQMEVNAAAAAVRIGAIVEKYAANDAERVLAGKFYMIAANLYLGSDAWTRAERLYVTAGRSGEFVELLRSLADATERRADNLLLKGAKGKIRSARLRIMAGVICRRAEALEAESTPSPELEGDEEEQGLFSDFRLSGRLELKDYNYFDEHRYVDADDMKQALLFLEASLPLGDHQLFASAQGRVEHAASDDEQDVELVEAYAEMHYRDWDLKIGQQIFSWGSGMLHNPTDNVGRWHSVDPFASERRGMPAALLRYSAGVTSMEVACIPTFIRTRLPEPGQRFFIYHPSAIANPYYFPNPQPPLLVSVGPPELEIQWEDVKYVEPDDSYFETNQYAARLSTALWTWDVALSYFQGYENIAVMSARPLKIDPADGTAAFQVRYVYPEEKVYGLDVAGTLGKFSLHLEGAFFDMKGTGEDVGVGDQDYWAYITGLEYPLEDVILSHDVHISVEYAGEIKDDEDERIYINRIYQDSLLVRVTYTVDYKLSFEFREYYNFDDDDSRTAFFATYRWSDNLGFKAGVDFFAGHDDTFFGAYDDNDRFYVEVKYSF